MKKHLATSLSQERLIVKRLIQKELCLLVQQNKY